MTPYARVSTGINGLDKILNYLQMGDNVVLQVDDVEDYKKFVAPYVQETLAMNQRLVYMRFANHPALLEAGPGIKIYTLNANSGFESFSTEVHKIISDEGRDVFYVFDCLSDLLQAWATDLMIGNFFVITCPYLFELNTVAYFAILRSRHSFKTVARIRETTQVLLDVYNNKGKLCVHPLKAWKRYTPTMFLPHIMEGDKFVPILNSADAASTLSYLTDKNATSGARNLDYWDRIFLKATNILEDPKAFQEKQEMVETLSRMLIGREKRMLSLVKEYFSLEDLLEIKKRLIGTGFIGGKSVGMLLARNILRNDTTFAWNAELEIHDSFYIGSDIFYSYMVQNGWWKLLMAQKTDEGYFEVAHELKSKMLHGVFPDEVKEQFQLMLEYFGQSPIIARSSSLLEDAFGNAFAGKYESYFCVNQGTPEERYRYFEETVRKIFASTMNEDALTYRLQRGMAQHDEQMALLVQRVSGSHRATYFFPDLAGVGLSYNTFVWQKGMDPKAGMLRIVFGLGTRAVNRVENDYPRIVALDAPLTKPSAKQEDIKRFSQSEVDILNLQANNFQTLPAADLLTESIEAHLDMIATRDVAASEYMQSLGKPAKDAWILTFDELLENTAFAQTMSNMLRKLEQVYRYPVDIEFTVNFNAQGKTQINLLQCRPFQTKGHYSRVELPEKINKSKILLQQEANFMGGSIYQAISRIIYIDPKEYAGLSLSEKYEVARLTGKLNKQIGRREVMPTILLGPGRWGTTTPAMGVPVKFSEINNITAIGEIAYQDGSLIPDLSFGTHFFQDMVEMDIFYMAIYPEKSDVFFNTAWMKKYPNILTSLLPDDKAFADVVRVFDVREKDLRLLSDIVTQKMVCFFGK
ncbi:MAG TPA: PEP/pyruvate-binding domain-containing protein [Smithella sp.]|nr:PEP/pyruvate-binding domain-containing protein [Smithellaceae bacterium]HPX31584.1 PEP/pyruvate-binding domain-containing protein [Smithella sp.]HQC19811.1 PEP/pyruvate-binding domain-containing protein [Smithella sp.]